MNSFTRKALLHVGVILSFLIITAMYFAPQLSGEAVPQGDVSQYMGMSQEVREFEKKTGKTYLWTNAMFGGMPTYQINSIAAGNLLRSLDEALQLGINEPIGRFFAAMVGFYILMLCLNVNPILGAIGSVAFGLTTNSLILFEAGHITKLATISYFPLIAAGVLLAFQRKYLLGGILFATGMGLDIVSNHVQMTYYLALTLLIFGVAQLIHSIRNKEMAHFARAAGVLLLAGAIGVASAASNLFVTYEYSRDTMRGKPILQADANADAKSNSSAVEGLAWDYAMQWSNNSVDVFASLIPGVAGGGGQESIGRNSATYQDLQRKGANPAMMNNLKLPLYWGALPFTSGPAYFGATLFFFFFLGLILIKGPVKWWLGLGTLLIFLLSMGKHLEWFNEPIFNYFPLYNKFRTPNSALSIASFLVPMLGFLALNEVLKRREEVKTIQRAVYISAGIVGVICLFFWLIGPSMFDFTHEGDAQLTQAGFNIETIIEDRQSLMSGDAMRSLFLVLLSGGLVWAFVQKRIQRTPLLIGLGILTLFDLWGIGRRYLDNDSFENKTAVNNPFKARPADELILKDKDPNFRVLDLTVSTFQSSFTSYYHKSLGGYHAAKLQRYQDIIDRHLTKNNQKVVNMLNTKYYIVQAQGEGGQPEVQVNTAAQGNAWFVNNLQTVQTANQEIDALTTFDPLNDAVIHQEFNNYIQNFKPQKDSTGSIALLTYEPDHLVYESNATSEQFAVFSEIWYGPDKGWNAYVDGKAVEHIRANYLLRGLRIPAGKHKVEFKFEPQSYALGKTVSTLFSSMIVLSLLGYVGFYGYEAFRKAQNEPKPEPRPVQPAPKPTSRPVPTPTRSTVTTNKQRPTKKGKR